MNNDTITIVVIAGTTRPARESIKAANYIAEFGRGLEHVEIIMVDPKDFTLPGDGNDPEGKDARYSDITARADAFFVISPEYNHSFPGSLKRLLDSELENYNHKPVAFAGVSNGSWGGVRAVEALVNTVREMGLVAAGWDVYFPRIQDIFDETGAMRAEYLTRYTHNVSKLYEELIWMARWLKVARANQLGKA